MIFSLAFTLQGLFGTQSKGMKMVAKDTFNYRLHRDARNVKGNPLEIL
jgi:hypothetical protein